MPETSISFSVLVFLTPSSLSFPKNSFLESVSCSSLSCNSLLYWSPVDVMVGEMMEKCSIIIWFNLSLLVDLCPWAVIHES